MFFNLKKFFWVKLFVEKRKFLGPLKQSVCFCWSDIFGQKIFRKLVNLSSFSIFGGKVTLNVFLSLFLSASYRQKGSSIVVHSFMNSMEPPWEK